MKTFAVITVFSLAILAPIYASAGDHGQEGNGSSKGRSMQLPSSKDGTQSASSGHGAEGN